MKDSKSQLFFWFLAFVAVASADLAKRDDKILAPLHDAAGTAVLDTVGAAAGAVWDTGAWILNGFLDPTPVDSPT